MAVLGRVLISGAERLDLPDLLSIDSFTAGDFKFLMQALVGADRPYILKGFDVINPADAIGGQTISINVANSVTFYPGSSAGPFFFGLPEGNTLSQPLVPELRKSATNFVYLTLDTQETAQDTRAFWDPDKEGGEGGEFNQDVNTESALIASINVSTSSFPENTIPICKVVVGTNFIESIEDSRDLMFRLGSGGLTPDPFSRYNFRSDPALGFERNEPNTLMQSALQPNPFFGGDKNIRTLKEWMDAVMTKIAELGGTSFWYEDSSSYNLVNLFLDALGTSIKSKGQWELDEATKGQVTWTEDINLRIMHDLREIKVRAGQKVLEDEEVMYFEYERNLPFNEGNLQVEWFESQNFVNGLVGAFENLSIGDWVKKQDDPDSYYRRVEAFFFSPNLGGGVTTAGTARSIQLSSAYPGITESRAGLYTKGQYLAGDIKVESRDTADLNDIGGNLFWLAERSDFLQAIDDITSNTITIDMTESDGLSVKCESASAHGLSDGEWVTIASGVYAGTYKIERESDTVFYIDIKGTGAEGTTTDESGIAVYWAVVTTTSTSSTVGYLEDSAAHNFREDQLICIEDTTVGYDGDYRIFVRDATTFSFAIPAPLPAANDGIARLPRVNVRTDLGATKLLPGDVKYIGQVEMESVMKYIGMESSSQIIPDYKVPVDYNALDGMANYNSSLDDNLTDRVSKLTSMMADKAQDKTITKAYSGFSGVTNVTNGTDQELRFVHYPSDTPQLQMLLPGSFNTTTVGLTGALTLAQNQAAYFLIDRNGDSIIADLTGLIVVDINDVPIGENVFIVAARFDTATCWLFDGTELDVGYTLTQNAVSDVLNANNYEEEITVIDIPASGPLEYQATDSYTEPNLIGVPENTVAPGNIINLPPDSRDSGQPMDYVIGKGMLQVYHNGQVLTEGKDWEEEVASGANLSPAIGLNDFVPVHLGTTITIQKRLFVGDKLTFRIDTAGGHSGPGVSSSGGGGGGGGEVNELVSAGNATDGFPLNNPKIGVNLVIKRLQAGSGVTLSQSGNGNAIIIEASTAGEANTASNLGTSSDGEGLFTIKSGTNLPFKRIKAGTGIALNSNANFIEIVATAQGEINDVLNLGTGADGEAIVGPKTGTNFFLKRITSTSGLDVTSNANSIILNVRDDINAEALAESMLNNTVSLITEGTPVSIAADGNIEPVDVSDAANAQAFLGVTLEDINPGQKGLVLIGGVLKNIGALNFRDILYVDKSGGLTNTKPAIGASIPAFANNDWVIEVGIVVADPDTSSQRNLIVRPRVVGKL